MIRAGFSKARHRSVFGALFILKGNDHYDI